MPQIANDPLSAHARRTSIEDSGPTRPSNLTAAIMKAWAAGNFEQAESMLVKEILRFEAAANAMDAKVYLYARAQLQMALSCLHALLGRNNEAQASHQKVIELADQYAGLFSDREEAKLQREHLLALGIRSLDRPKDPLNILGGLSGLAALNPEDTLLAMRVAAQQLWFGQETDYVATCRRVLLAATDPKEPAEAERAAKITSLRTQKDPELREAARNMAQRAVELGRDMPGSLPWYQMSLGMAEYRSGHFAAANEALQAAIKGIAKDESERHRYIVGCTAALYQAMSCIQQGKTNEARALVEATEAKLEPLPTDDQNPTAGNIYQDDFYHDDLILWLAYKEARTLLSSVGAR